jgi:hypothetical protein
MNKGKNVWVSLSNQKPKKKKRKKKRHRMQWPMPTPPLVNEEKKFPFHNWKSKTMIKQN